MRIVFAMVLDESKEIPVADLGERLGALRLCEASALDAMRRSLARHGQMTAAVGFVDGGSVEIIDGFKRLRAARALGWATLRAQVVEVDASGATLLIAALHAARNLTELEEGWLVRALYREHGLLQPAIAQRLGRHKSWVHRRLMLVEALDPAVQADVRLGLLAPRAAVVLGQLPRGNQHATAGVVIRRGLTVRQAELMVAELLECSDDVSLGPGESPITRRDWPRRRGPGLRPTRAARRG
ncbi:MAG: ParB N-terminal domain-containing protein [Polyangiaceae bacterium]|nr:ParB N-terminal domain-containing protein [Polyangiaceae bacterium]